jgi:hypothetical protein
MKRAIALVIAAAFSVFDPGIAHAFNIGWNFIRVLDCVGYQIQGVDYLFIYPTTGGALVTADLGTINAAAQFCANGNAFYILWDGAAWNGVLIYPGLR